MTDPTSTDQQQAIKAGTGTPRPEYDQYEVNQPGNLNKQAEAQGAHNVDDGSLEHSLDTTHFDSAQPGEISSDPGDSNTGRPLGKD